MRTNAIFRLQLLGLLACIAEVALPCGVGASTIVPDVAAGPVIDVPFLASHYFQSVAVLPDGSFALSGTTTVVPPGSDGFPQFEVQTYARDGSLSGSPFVPEEGHPVDTGGIVPLSDRYLVSWQHYVAKTSSATFLSPAGEASAPPFPWPNSDIEDYHKYYRWGGGRDYRFLPVMYHQDGLDPSGDPVRQPTLQVYGPDAKPLGSSVSLAATPSRIYIDDMAMNGNGRFVVLYQRCAKSFFPISPCPLGFQVFEGTGQAQTPLLTQDVAQAESAQGLRNGGVTVGLEPGGKFLLLWAIRVNANLYRLFVQLFNPQGSPLMEPLQLAQAPPSGFLLERAFGLDDGSFGLAWQVADESGIESVYISRFDSSSLQASEPTLITMDSLAPEVNYIDVNHAGQGIVIWATYHPENPDPFAGYARPITFRPHRLPKQPPGPKARP